MLTMLSKVHGSMGGWSSLAFFANQKTMALGGAAGALEASWLSTSPEPVLCNLILISGQTTCLNSKASDRNCLIGVCWNIQSLVGCFP